MNRNHQESSNLLAELAEWAPRLTRLTHATVFALFDDRQLAYERGNLCSVLRYERVIIATGTYDRPVPMPGWTLPGVITVGAAQSLVKMQGVLPGRRIVLAGCGPLLWVLAWQILNAGGKLAALVDAGRVQSWPRLLIRLAENLDIAADALAYQRVVRRRNVPVFRGHVAMEVHGNHRVEGVSIAPIDRNWHPERRKIKNIPADAFCMGYGLVPDGALTRLAGCTHDYLPQLGGWVPVRNRNMQTSVQEIYAVGDCAGVAGSSAAHCEGRLAGIDAAYRLGYLSRVQARTRSKSWRKRLHAVLRLQKELNHLTAFGPGLYELAQPATVLCRCEEVPLARIMKAIDLGLSDLNEIKRFTRAGMGRCQGRMCGPALQEIVSQSLGVEPDKIGALSVRPPIKPVKMGAIASLARGH